MRLSFHSETLEKVSRVLSLISKMFEIVEIQRKRKFFLDVRCYITLKGNCEIIPRQICYFNTKLEHFWIFQSFTTVGNKGLNLAEKHADFFGLLVKHLINIEMVRMTYFKQTFIYILS